MAAETWRDADDAYPGTPPCGDISSDEEYVPLPGNFHLTTLGGDRFRFPFDERTSIGWIVSLVLGERDVFGKGDRPREGQLVFGDRIFKPCEFAEKVWKSVDGLDDKHRVFNWVFHSER